ncbi:hypothetical protein M0811_07925 [Anaeramoeba ignava]|uniref:Uncharacterized protein n=1 Tax=Anaeramoeba ignava TaxID=1746090 RepID=A0A9Q0LL22_ANAIG|nr:hypothetical protein M0811_07925 [Anaeramoeba ignava]
MFALQFLFSLILVFVVNSILIQNVIDSSYLLEVYETQVISHIRCSNTDYLIGTYEHLSYKRIFVEEFINGIYQTGRVLGSTTTQLHLSSVSLTEFWGYCFITLAGNVTGSGFIGTIDAYQNVTGPISLSSGFMYIYYPHSIWFSSAFGDGSYDLDISGFELFNDGYDYLYLLLSGYSANTLFPPLHNQLRNFSDENQEQDGFMCLFYWDTGNYLDLMFSTFLGTTAMTNLSTGNLVVYEEEGYQIPTYLLTGYTKGQLSLITESTAILTSNPSLYSGSYSSFIIHLKLTNITITTLNLLFGIW